MRCCPPAPVPENHSTLKSTLLYSTAFTLPGVITATVTVDVCTLPLRSVGGTLCILCPPGSLSSPVKSAPSTSIEIVSDPDWRCIQPTRLKCFVYACAKSNAKSFASSPPSAALISMIRFMLFSLKISNMVPARGVEPRSKV